MESIKFVSILSHITIHPYVKSDGSRSRETPSGDAHMLKTDGQQFTYFVSFIIAAHIYVQV